MLYGIHWSFIALNSVEIIIESTSHFWEREGGP